MQRHALHRDELNHSYLWLARCLLAESHALTTLRSFSVFCEALIVIDFNDVLYEVRLTEDSLGNASKVQ